VKWDSEPDTTTIVLRDAPAARSAVIGCLTVVDLDAEDQPLRIILAIPRGEATIADWADLVAAYPSVAVAFPSGPAFVRRVREAPAVRVRP
jgi:hypothetical protein